MLSRHELAESGKEQALEMNGLPKSEAAARILAATWMSVLSADACWGLAGTCQAQRRQSARCHLHLQVRIGNQSANRPFPVGK